MARSDTEDESSLTVGVVGEYAAGENRVAVTPDGVGRLRAVGLDVLVESGAGQAAWFPDAAYSAAGARLGTREGVFGTADVLLCIRPPDDLHRLRPGQALIGLLQPATTPELVQTLAERGVTAISLDGLPRTLSRAQAMDALTSQANIAGYKAVLVAAHSYPSYFPMLMTAAGTARPAQVLVLGAGVAGLQAIGTARRLGAVVTGYDVRDSARAEVESVGGTFLDLGEVVGGSGEGGYARALTSEEQDRQRAAVTAAVGRFDVVITTAQAPGRQPPLLVPAVALDQMRPGSVVVDLAVSELGGNVEGAVPDATVLTAGGVTLIGAGNLAATVPQAASAAYSRNVVALLGHLIHDGSLSIDPTDEIQAGVLVTHGGQVVHPGVKQSLTDRPPTTANSERAAS